MTDRHAAYIVVLDRDIREDDAEGILNALRHIRFVAGVEPVIATHELTIARVRQDGAWSDALAKLASTGPGKQDER
jgi:hypothetical protein